MCEAELFTLNPNVYNILSKYKDIYFYLYNKRTLVKFFSVFINKCVFR